MARFEPVVRDAGIEVVDVVEADVAGEPLQQARQLEVGAALERRRNRMPGRLPGPERILEPMLDREQPDADDRADGDDRTLDQQHRRGSRA
jgi:hypothetical protein